MSNYRHRPQDIAASAAVKEESQFESFASDLLFPLEIEEPGRQYQPEMYNGWIPMSCDSDKLISAYSAYDSVFDFDEASSDPSLFQPLPSTTDGQLYADNNLYYNPPTSSYNPTPFGISSPIPIPAASEPQTPALSPCFSDVDVYPQDASFSPSAFAALQPLPRSISPTYEASPFSALFSEHTSGLADQWPQLTHPSMAMLSRNVNLNVSVNVNTTPSDIDSSSLASSPLPASPAAIGIRNAHVRSRQRSDARKESRNLASVLTFASSSAPSSAGLRSRPNSHVRSISDETMEDRDATVRRKKRLSAPEGSDRVLDIGSIGETAVPTKSELKPPKLAPSAWQLYFTDWIQNYQARNPKKLNVAQAAKEAGQEYATLPEHEKDVYRAKSQVLKDRREREHENYMRGLSPGDIKRENMFRAAQRKSGRSRKSNIKDPNAPKKPLSAYFMFLAHIRANAYLVQEVFGNETETTKQSVLAAAKWRDMTDDERKPFLARAEREKLDYEAARRIYENVTDHGETSITFSASSSSSRAGPLMMSRTTSLQTDSADSVDSDADMSLNDHDYDYSLDRFHRF